ncbi:MAG: ABC transporter ATP-binding protein [Bryobacteraceae bacterium]
MGTAIRVEQLSKKYPSGDMDLVVLHDFNLEVNIGERLAITGESGSGKSTLLHLLGGVDRPSGGKILYGSRDIFSFSDAELAKFRNREVGFVWQVQSLLPEFTALENVSMPLRIRGEETSEAARLALASLEEVGLGKRAAHRAGELSGGEQQRVALARALAGKPQVLLADEPTGNLDPRTGEMIIRLLDELHRAHGFTSVVVTHNVSFARRCDRIIELGAGAGSEPRAETYGRDYV